METKIDKHHILHDRQEWELRPQGLYLRQQPTLIPRMERPVHDELHRIAPPVPLLGYFALLHVDGLFKPASDTLGSLDNLMLAIDKASRHERARPFEAKLAQLAIEALDMQRDFLRGNVIE